MEAYVLLFHCLPRGSRGARLFVPNLVMPESVFAEASHWGWIKSRVIFMWWPFIKKTKVSKAAAKKPPCNISQKLYSLFNSSFCRRYRRFNQLLVTSIHFIFLEWPQKKNTEALNERHFSISQGRKVNLEPNAQVILLWTVFSIRATGVCFAIVQHLLCDAAKWSPFWGSDSSHGSY